MESLTYSLSPLLRIVWMRKSTVLLITLITMAIGLAIYFIRPKQYRATVEFFLKNPLYADRNYLYNSDARMIDYFAGDEDIDRMRSLMWSDSLQDKIIREMRLDQAYNMDMSKPADAKQMKKTFSNHLNLYRTESKVAVLSYADKDEERAAAVASRCVELLERQLRGFYNEMRNSISATLNAKIDEEDSVINELTDSLATLRERYDIYDIISPARYNIMLSTMKDNGRPGYAKGMELVQNVEAIKDELVSDRSKHITLAGQYTTGTKMNELPITRILKVEKPPLTPEGPGLLTTLLGCGAAGFFFALLYVMAAFQYRSIATKQA